MPLVLEGLAAPHAGSKADAGSLQFCALCLVQGHCHSDRSVQRSNSFVFLVRNLPRCIVGLPLVAAVSGGGSLKLTLLMGWAAVSLQAASVTCKQQDDQLHQQPITIICRCLHCCYCPVCRISTHWQVLFVYVT